MKTEYIYDLTMSQLSHKSVIAVGDLARVKNSSAEQLSSSVVIATLANGNHVVSVTVTDNSGNSDTATRNFTVNNLINSFSITPTLITEGNTSLTVTASLSSAVLTWGYSR